MLQYPTALYPAAAHLGFTLPGILPFLITPALYLGPLYSRFLGKTLPLQRNWSFREDVVSLFFSVIGVRNHLVVSSSATLCHRTVTAFQAPITEEVVFRACVLSGYYFAGASRSRMIFLSPLVFGAGKGMQTIMLTCANLDAYCNSPRSSCLGDLQQVWP